MLLVTDTPHVTHTWSSESKPRCTVCGTLRSDCHGTPYEELDRVRRIFGGVIDLDPCSDILPFRHHALQNFTTEGLKVGWHGNTFVNPPYSQLATWVPRCSAEMQATVIALIPPSVGTNYWHDQIFAKAQAVCFVKGRFAFRDPDTDIPAAQNRYDSSYVLWRAKGDVYKRFWEECSRIGRVVAV